VQALARLGMWHEAFVVCERRLIGQWGGWYRVRVRANVKNQLPLELRRLGSSPARPRPIAHTLIILAKEYMELERMTLWSQEASALFKKINKQCVGTVRAINTLVRTNSPLEVEVFGGRHGKRRAPVEWAESDGTNEDQHEAAAVMTEPSEGEAAERAESEADKATTVAEGSPSTRNLLEVALAEPGVHAAAAKEKKKAEREARKKEREEKRRLKEEEKKRREEEEENDEEELDEEGQPLQRKKRPAPKMTSASFMNLLLDEQKAAQERREKEEKEKEWGLE